MGIPRQPRWRLGVVVGLAAWGIVGLAPAQAHTMPIIVPPIAPIMIGIPGGLPSRHGGLPGTSTGNSRADLTWSTRGRADVDVEIDRQHGQAAVR